MLIEFQERYNLKNRELALLCGCSLPTVQKWRSGNVPLPAVVHRLEAFF
jgi:DNA-binding transcriptional regulator YiaG